MARHLMGLRTPHSLAPTAGRLLLCAGCMVRPVVMGTTLLARMAALMLLGSRLRKPRRWYRRTGSMAIALQSPPVQDRSRHGRVCVA